LRIAQVCPRYYPYYGGVQTHVAEISTRLRDRGFNVEIITTDPSGVLRKEEMIDGMVVKRFRSWAPNDSYFFSSGLKDYLKRNSAKYDVVHAHNYHALPSLYAAQAKSDNRLVFTPRYHGGGHTLFRNLLHAPYRRFGEKIFRLADRVICLSKFEMGLILAKFGVDPRKVELIPNGINSSQFTQLERQSPSGPRLLCVSRLEKYKGVDWVIKCLPRLDDKTTLTIIGEGPHKDNLLKLILDRKLQGKVRLIPRLPRAELLKEYANADVFLLLSKFEAFGNVVAEALASGTHCIVATTSALSEWVDNENCYGISYPISLDVLASLIRQASRKASGGPAVVRLLDWDDVVDRLEPIYLNKPSSRR
jgi:glycosyltransferase involved in cell wall biosynthesis